MSELEPTRLQMLRLGRGNGARECLRAGSGAIDDVVTCVLDDPRWDRQIEERDQYYARLLFDFDADICPIERHVLDNGDHPDESEFWLAIGVLAQMAKRGHARAREAIAEAIGTGCRWRTCLNALEAAGGESLIGVVVRAEHVEQLVRSVDAEALADAAQIVAAPWEEWAMKVPSLRFVSGARTNRTAEPRPVSGPVQWIASGIRMPAPPPINPRLTTSELVDVAATTGAWRHVEKILRARLDESTTRVLLKAATAGTPEQRLLALRLLGERGCLELVREAEEFLREQSHPSPDDRSEPRKRHAFIAYLERLPANSILEQGRRWFSERWPLSLVGEHILARYATPEDRTTLEEAGSAALTSREMYRVCSVVDALATIGAAESLPFLAEVYSSAPYSLARRRVVRALLPHGADDVACEFLLEALWDCEPEARELGCGAVTLNQLASAARVAEIADDEFEESGVRHAAQLARQTPSCSPELNRTKRRNPTE